MIVGIAGKIATGKSTLARAVAARLKAKHVGFGDYVRSIATSSGLDPTDRTVLQSLGENLVARSARAFVGDVLLAAQYEPPENIVFDGVRHSVIWQEIRDVAARAGESSFLIFLDMPETTRQRRWMTRGVDRLTAREFDDHASESDLKAKLHAEADLTLDARLDEAELVDKIARLAEAT